ncbi:MAG: response regulator transcription factor [Verrucomicrobiae bacterium]|nr:response regulator transcription factor [Verrucomicrobiae bacterium]
MRPTDGSAREKKANGPHPTVLVIDGDPQVRRLLHVAFERIGWRVIASDSGQLGVSEAAFARPDAVLLDIGLPDMDGREVILRIREWSRIPIIALSEQDGPEAKIQTLDAGADDFVTKPFHVGELLARLRAVGRRSQQPGDRSEVSCGSLRIDLAARAVTVAGRGIHLTPIEYAVLRCLAQNVGKVVTQQHLLREVWGPEGQRYTKHLRVHMTHLRQKLAGAGVEKGRLRTEPRVGYCLGN